MSNISKPNNNNEDVPETSEKSYLRVPSLEIPSAFLDNDLDAEDLEYIDSTILKEGALKYIQEETSLSGKEGLSLVALIKRLDRIELTLSRLCSFKQLSFDLLDSYSANSKSAPNEMYIRSEGRLIRIRFDEILFLESVGDYIKVVETKPVFFSFIC